MNNRKKLIPILSVIAVGIALGGLILSSDKTSQSISGDSAAHPAHEAPAVEGKASSNYREGPKGGKLFTEGGTDGFGLEVTIFEANVPPRFRLYLYEKSKPLPPAAAKVIMTLSRLGAPVQVFKFTPEADYLVSDQIVEEPHSFDAVITAQWKGKTIHWEYSQVEARVEMPDEMLKGAGIEIRTAGPAIIKPLLKLPGEIIFNEHTIVQVVPRLPGIVTAVKRHHGQQVQKGEILVVIESQMLAELRSQYRVAKKRLGLAQTTYERERQLWEEKISAKQDYLVAQELLNEAEIALDLAAVKLQSLGVQPEAPASSGNLASYEVRAPISGLIIDKTVALGQTLKEDEHIFVIADVSTVWAGITIYPKDLDVVKVGQKATVRATASNLEGEGVVIYITTLIGGQTRTATARLALQNREGKWRPGMFVTAEMVAAEIPVPVAVSADALQTLHDSTVVFGRYGEYFEARPLELGRSDGKTIEVLRGLEAGEQYAAGNSFAIKAELGKSGATHEH
ncbi:membrane fusion protein, cobalt-zinc-cadmium efflux system [Nitrosospira multiformis]|uniref:Membrane fusion protein, cobalt-zinc-cadmium efflux system n=1 Tax=Nitrosospira multiformis TaxID=1231 RepID=A0A1H9YLG7_9PROT|nr:efflux RND transporter periplasmic adaptor subunit [Nitrosospira multiformis]SES69894.1 membrane fusion protein, cobalt-zinc-cadmium efflux system [Nitrosospira multiformis]